MNLAELRERADQLEREEGLDQTAAMMRDAASEIERLQAEYAAYRQGAELLATVRLAPLSVRLRRYGFWWARKVTVVEAEDASDAFVLFEKGRALSGDSLYPVDAVLALTNDDCGECCGGRIAVPGVRCVACDGTKKRWQQL